jgi:ABC-type transport system involved in cytochrome c biogenesis ATPase subunit
MPGVAKNKMSTEEEIEFVKLIEEKTGEIVPGNALNLLTVTLDDLEKLLTIEKLSKNQKKKVLRRQKWVSLIDCVKNNLLILAS